MAAIEKFLAEIDSKWKPIGEEPIALQLIGSAALMLQTDYVRGTKDGDVLESRDGSPEIKTQLLALAGKQTDLHVQFRLYIDVVYNSDDANDIRAMADRKLVDHRRLVSRFQAAADWFSMDARAPDVARYLKNLHKAERDILDVPLSEIELPETQE